MRKVIKNVILITSLITFSPLAGIQAVDSSNKPVSYKVVNDSKSSAFDWNSVMAAIIEVESEGNPRAVSGKSVGVMQITPVLVEDCNQILKRRNSNKRYTLADRYNVQKSKEMFLLYQSWYNPENDVEQAIRSWNGGMRYTKRGTQRYFEKVMKAMKK